MAAALLNPEGFRRRIATLIEESIKRGRGEDLDRIASHVRSSQPPGEVSRLAALMYLVDQEFLLPLQEAIDAHRRWHEMKKGAPVGDDALLETMYEVYESTRSSDRTL